MLHKSWGIVNVVSVSGIAGHPGQSQLLGREGRMIAFTKRSRSSSRRAASRSTRRSGLVDTEIIGHLKDDVRKEFSGASRWLASARPRRSRAVSASSRRRRPRT
jgi:hypothetical protein